MAYLDSAGNVSDMTVQNWTFFHRQQNVLPKGQLTPPPTPLPAGAEKASKGTH